MCTTLINDNNVKPIAIYVHGLGSGATSTTVRMVCKIFSEYEWIAIEVNENPFESVEKINATVSKFNPSLLMGTRFTEYESSHKVVNGTKNYALFAVHDELIGDADMLDNMAMVFESGYRLLLDSKGGHRHRAAALKLLHREISK